LETKTNNQIHLTRIAGAFATSVGIRTHLNHLAKAVLVLAGD